jgi:hypothetical protein
VLTLAASGVAGAQYVYSVSLGSMGPVDCINSQGNASQNVHIAYTLTSTYTLPATPNNVVYFLYLNGALQGKDFDTESPPSGSFVEPDGDLFWDTPASPPFTVVIRGFPASNGTPVGTGFEYRVQCNSLGVGTGIGTASVIQAPVTPPAPDLNQHGLTGSWYEPATGGQGIEVEVFPDSSSGTGSTFVSWFTYDTVIGGAERQRWYTAQGQMVSGQPYASLTIYRNTGGNFNAPPITNAQVVGNATLSFDTCSSGQLSYNFTDGTGREGSILLTRLTQNVTCTTTTARPANADFAFSGNWYDPATSGQGLTVELNPINGVLFAPWYTYAPNAAGSGAAGQRWYTVQAAHTPGMRTIPVTIYETTGGVFDKPTPPGQNTVPVGSGTVAFQSCSAATFSYNFTGGSTSGQSGTITLRRVGPLPPGCTT